LILVKPLKTLASITILTVDWRIGQYFGIGASRMVVARTARSLPEAVSRCSRRVRVVWCDGPCPMPVRA
jgi:hypothetical protein